MGSESLGLVGDYVRGVLDLLVIRMAVLDLW